MPRCANASDFAPLAIICLKHKRLKVSHFNSFLLIKIIILDRFGKSRENFVRFIVFKNVKKITQSQRHLRSVSLALFAERGYFTLTKETIVPSRLNKFE